MDTSYEHTFSNGDPQQDLRVLSLALEASISGVIITDNRQPDNPIVYCNKAFETITGYTRDEVIGHNCRFLQREDRKQPERDILRDTIKRGHSCVLEIRNYKKDGTLFWNELYMAPVKNTSGEVTHFIGIQNDISRRKHAEQELRRQQELMENRIAIRTRHLQESEEYLNSIFQTVRESLIVLTPGQEILNVNDHFLRTFKVSREETEGKSLYNLGNGQWNIEALRKLLQDILPTNNPVLDFEVQHEFPHIGKKIMLLNAHRIELEGSFKDRILLAIEDVTGRRDIEKRKDDFLSIASHELKTPLTAIKGFIQLLTKLIPHDGDERLRHLVEKTETHVERLNNLITELLDVSRIQTGNIEMHREPFDFDLLLHETVEGLQAATKTHRIQVTGESKKTCYGDESHIMQVINNLLSNALKYSPASDQVDVHVCPVSDFIKLSVTDYGLGINRTDQDRIFERFYRADSLQKKFPGMGVGLYICDQIIKNHGGTIWVESQPGKGSTFSFTLPVYKPNEKND